MKELLSLTGGYKRHMDYLLKLQSEMLGVHNSLFKNLGHDLVLSGCEVTDNLNGTGNIANGVVYVAGEIVRFVATANVALNGSKALTLGAPITTDAKEFNNGTTKNIYSERFAVIADATNLATEVVIGTSLYGIKEYIADIVQSYGQKGETKWIIDLDNSFLANFDGSGAGVTAKWLGWHLMNGDAGTPDMSGRVPIGAGSFVDAYGLQHTYTNSQTGGQPRHKISISEMPVHSHGLKMRFSGYRHSDSGRTYTPIGEISKGLSNERSGDTNNEGGDTAHNIMQPFRVGYWVIKLT